MATRTGIGFSDAGPQDRGVRIPLGTVTTYTLDTTLSAQVGSGMSNALPTSVSNVPIVGVSTASSREDHAHQGLRSINVVNNASYSSAYGDATITNSLAPTYSSATIPQLSGSVNVSGNITAPSATIPQLSGPVNVNGNITATAIISSGMPGAQNASRYVGATASGTPTTGTFSTGDLVVSQAGAVYVCTSGGTPGTWVNAGGGVASATVVSETTYGIISTPGAANSSSRGDHTHGSPTLPVTSLSVGGGTTTTTTTTPTGTFTGQLGTAASQPGNIVPGYIPAGTTTTTTTTTATTANLTITAAVGAVQLNMSSTPVFTSLTTSSGNSTITGLISKGSTTLIQNAVGATQFTFDTTSPTVDGLGVLTTPAGAINGSSITTGTLPYSKLSGNAQASVQAFSSTDNPYSFLRRVTATPGTLDAPVSAGGTGLPIDGLTTINGSTRITDAAAYAGYAITNTGMTTNVIATGGPGVTTLQPGQYQATYYFRVNAAPAATPAVDLQVTGTSITNNPVVTLSATDIGLAGYVGYAVPFTVTAATNSVNTTIFSLVLPSVVAWSFSHVRVTFHRGSLAPDAVTYFLASASITSAQIQSISASQISAGTLNADMILGARIKTADTGSRVELGPTGLLAFNGANQTVTLSNTGTFQLASAGSVTGVSRLNMSSTAGIQIYNGASVTPVFNADLSGNVSIIGAITASSGAFTGDVQISTGSLYMLGPSGSMTTGQRTILDITSERHYDNAGVLKLTIANDGSITSSATSTFTAGIFKTSATVGDGTANGFGIIHDSFGTRAFQASNSSPTFSIAAATGAVFANLGSIAGFSITGGNLNSGGTSTSSINLDTTNGIYLGGTSGATRKFQVSMTGDAYIGGSTMLAGTLTVASTATLTGTLSTAAGAGNGSIAGVVLSSTGLNAYNNHSSTPTVSIRNDGSATFTGNINASAISSSSYQTNDFSPTVVLNNNGLTAKKYFHNVTLAVACLATDTTISVVIPVGIEIPPPAHTIFIAGEWMDVTSHTTATNWVVVRGILSTPVTAHAIGTGIGDLTGIATLTLGANGGSFAGTVNAEGGTFSGNITAYGTISGGYIAGSTISGSTISGGNISIAGGVFAVDANGVLTATQANIAGTINASAGTIGGWTISASSLSGAGTITGGNGAFNVDNAGNLFIGYSTFAACQANGFAVDVTGNAYAVKFARGGGQTAGTNSTNGVMTSGQPIPAGGWNTVVFNQKGISIEDNGSMWSPGSSQVAVPVLGDYVGWLALYFPITSTAGPNARVGVSWLSQGGRRFAQHMADSTINQAVNTCATLRGTSAGYFFTPQGYNAVASTLNVDSNTAPCQFRMTMIA